MDAAQQKFDKVETTFVAQVDPKVLKIVTTVAVVSIALTMRKQARIAAHFAQESIRLQKIALEAYNIPT
jgi:hypothetical protein